MALVNSRQLRFPLSGSFTGSFSGSFVGNGAGITNVASSSFALTASFALNAGGTVFNTGSFVTTSSFNAYTSSLNSKTGSFATTGSNTFKGNQIISGSITLEGGSKITNEYDIVSVDIQAGPGGYAELLSNNTNSQIWVDDSGSYITTAGTHVFTFNNSGSLKLPITGSQSILNPDNTPWTASYATTASFALFALNGGATNQITTGSITASVDVSPNNLFLIKSSSNVYFNISSSSNTTLSSNLFIIKNFTTQQPVLTISQSIVQFATQSSIPTGTTQAGSIWFTSSSLYIGLE
jgi:hypothetical protein